MLKESSHRLEVGDMQQRSEGLLQARDWDVPAEEAASPTLSSAAAL